MANVDRKENALLPTQVNTKRIQNIWLIESNLDIRARITNVANDGSPESFEFVRTALLREVVTKKGQRVEDVLKSDLPERVILASFELREIDALKPRSEVNNFE